MINIIIGIGCLIIAILTILNVILHERDDLFFGIVSLVMGCLNLGIGIITVFGLHTTYIVTINRMDGTSIEVEAQDYDIDDTYVKVKQDNSNVYIYNVKDVTITKKDK